MRKTLFGFLMAAVVAAAAFSTACKEEVAPSVSTQASAALAPSVFVSVSTEVHAEYMGNCVGGKMIYREADRFYLAEENEDGEMIRGEIAYAALYDANAAYSEAAYLENPALPVYDCYLAKTEEGTFRLLYKGMVYTLPAAKDYFFRLPYLVGTHEQKTDEGTETRYSFFALSNLSSDLSVLRGQDLLADVYGFVDFFDAEGDGINDAVILHDGASYIAFDQNGARLFLSSAEISILQNGENTYFVLTDGAGKKSLFTKEGDELYNNADYVANQPDEYTYLYAVRFNDVGNVLEGAVVFGSEVLYLGAEDEAVSMGEDHVIAYKDGVYYFFNGEARRLPYENIVAANGVYMAYASLADTTVTILNRALEPILSDVSEEIDLSPLSDAENGVFCFAEPVEAGATEAVYTFYTDRTGEAFRLSVSENESIETCEITGFYKITSAEGLVSLFSAFTGESTAAFDSVAVRYENGVKFAVAKSSARSCFVLLDLETFREVSLFGSVSAAEAPFQVELSETVALANRAENNAVAIVVLSFEKKNGTKEYYGITRKGAYGADYGTLPLVCVKLVGSPMFTAVGGLLVCENPLGGSVCYNVGEEGVKERFSTEESIQSAMLDRYTMKTYFIIKSINKLHVMNDKGIRLHSQQGYDEITEVSNGYFIIEKDGTFGVYWDTSVGRLQAVTIGAKRVEIYPDGLAIVIDAKDKATVYRNNASIYTSLTTANVYLHVDKVEEEGEESFAVRYLYSFSFADGAELLVGGKVPYFYNSVHASGSFGDALSSIG